MFRRSGKERNEILNGTRTVGSWHGLVAGSDLGVEIFEVVT